MSGKIIPGRRKFSILNDDYVMYKDLVTDIIFPVPRFAGLEAPISGSKIVQKWRHISQPNIVYEEYVSSATNVSQETHYFEPEFYVDC